MENKNYKEIVDKHYKDEAKNRKLSLSSTMPDLNIRRLEIENIVKYLDDNVDCLEVGCGNGAASIEISRRKKLNLLSVDGNDEMIDLAKQQSTDGIKGKIEFSQKDVLNINELSSFDTVFSIRCIINLMKWEDQKKALTNMANAVKKMGKLIILEAFSDGLTELNQARKEFGLDSIPPAFHNLHLKKELVIQHLENQGLNLIAEDNFLSSYYFGSRVIYPVLAKANNQELVKNSKIDSFFSNFPPYGNFSHIKILEFRKQI